MNEDEFEQFVRYNGKDILRFCRMTCRDEESGDELYQDTMLKLLDKLHKLDLAQNVKSYALSISILLWKNKKKKYANRTRLVPMESIYEMESGGSAFAVSECDESPEAKVLDEHEKKVVQTLVESLPEMYRLPIYLHYSSDMSVKEIAEALNIPVGTVKSRMSKAKQLLRKELEAMGYDR